MPEHQEITKELIREVMREIFEEFPFVPEETHFRHHQYIEELIVEHRKRLALEDETQKARRDMYWDIAKSVTQWSVLGLLGGLLYFIQHGQWPTY